MISVDMKALLERLNGPCAQAVESAAGACLSRTHYEVTVEQVLAKLLESPSNDLTLILRHASCSSAEWSAALERVLDGLPAGNRGKPVFSPFFLEWLQEAWLISSIDFGETTIRSGTLLLALLAHMDRFADPRLGGLWKNLRAENIRATFKSWVKDSSETPRAGEPAPRSVSAQAGSALEKFGTDFTRKAANGQVDPVFGRDREIYQMIDILARRRKNNPILVGEAGVGKTAVVEGLALRIAQGNVPEALRGVGIVGLDMGLLQAGAGVQGEFEQRLKSVIQEIKGSPKPLILFIDEAHTLIGAGGPAGGSDAANLLKPALARGELRTIAATTWSEYKRYFEKDPALARRFQPVKLDEPSVEEAVRILRGLKPCYEEAHGIAVRDSAVVAAAEYAGRYISGRQLPDKAVDLLDTAAARAKGLLTSKPAAIEDREREMECLQREKEGLQRDALHGEASPAGRLLEIDEKSLLLRQDIASLSSRWQQEKELAHRLIELRKDLVRTASAGELEKLAVLKEEANNAVLKLKTLQAGVPLVPTDVDADMVARVVSDWTGIPLGKVLRDQSNAIAHLESNLAKRIKGQDAAVAQICQTLRASKAGLKEPHQPLGVFLLVGPSGVGKTETALAIADLLFGGERFLHTINMSEFRESHSISRLIGSPPGYVGFGEGGILTEAVRQKPYSVVLIDEVEKGHLDVTNLFYQVFDKGFLADGEGRSVDFRNTVIFLTSNLQATQPVLSQYFKPALLARMQVVPYGLLDAGHLKDIVRLKLERLAARVRDNHKITLTFTDAVADQLAARCLQVESGARTIDHVLKDTLMPELSKEILAGVGGEAMPAEMRWELSSEGEMILKPVACAV